MAIGVESLPQSNSIFETAATEALRQYQPLDAEYIGIARHNALSAVSIDNSAALLAAINNYDAATSTNAFINQEVAGKGRLADLVEQLAAPLLHDNTAETVLDLLFTELQTHLAARTTRADVANFPSFLDRPYREIVRDKSFWRTEGYSREICKSYFKLIASDRLWFSA